MEMHAVQSASIHEFRLYRRQTGSNPGLRCLKPGSGYYTMAVSPDNHWLATAPSNQLTNVAVWNRTELIAACPNDTAVSGDQPK
jgi:hypothetical protein